ncbi:MAG: SAM-dependent methyltransferase [Anaerolineae bacterium]
MSSPPKIPDGIALDKPSAARIYDFFLGGFHNFEIDRLVAKQALQIYPDARLTAIANRAFLRRVVNFLIEQGIDQFLDLGSGIPTVGNVHEVAQAANPAARVVYVDIDPIAIRHSEAILRDNPNASAIQADVRQPEQILDHEEVRRLIDFSQPTAVLLIALLHLIPDDEEAYSAVRTLRDAVVPGSYLAIAQGTDEKAPPDVAKQLEELGASTPTPNKNRSRPEIELFFEGLELVDPGLVHVPLWRPEGPDDVLLDRPERSINLGGVGRKPRAGY